MKLVVYLSNVDHLQEILLSPADVVAIPLENFAHRVEKALPVEELEAVLKTVHDHHKEGWLSVNRLFHQDDLDSLDALCQTLNMVKFEGLIFADLAVLKAARRFNLESNLIYAPETYNTSLEDTNFWQRQGVQTLVLSRELMLDDLVNIASQAQTPIGFFGHGYINIFHSRRPLIDHYFTFTQEVDVESVKQARNLTLIEHHRDAAFPVFEDYAGTHIFRALPRASMNVFDRLFPVLEYFIIDTLMFDLPTILSTLDDYDQARKAKCSEAIKDRYYEGYDDGLYFKRTHPVRRDEE